MKIAGIRFRDNSKVYDFDASDVEISVGDRVIVESDRGQGFARVVRLNEPPEDEAAAEVSGEEAVSAEEAESTDDETVGPPPSAKKQQRKLRKILRKATDEDFGKEEKSRDREAEAFTICQQLIEERELPMKLIRVEYTFDGSKASFFFFSESRVDFRELVKELAYKLKTRIEMRQIGVRDVARMIGGFGPCGRELCCASFLRNFEPVSIRMAKKQEMVLNPAKISGVCGRLLCCLSYEYEFYDEIKKDVAELRHAAKAMKAEETHRLGEEWRKADAEERRTSGEKKRPERQKQGKEPRREKQKGGESRGGKKPEKKQEKKGEQQRAKQQPRQEQPKKEQQPKKDQQQKPDAKPSDQQQTGEKAAQDKSKRKRRFWRKRRKKKK